MREELETLPASPLPVPATRALVVGGGLADRALAIWRVQDERDPVYEVGALTERATLRLAADEPDAAFALYAEALAIQETAYGEDSPLLDGLLGDYARALRRAGREEEAAALDARRGR